MGFLHRGCPITRFRLHDQPTPEQLQDATAALARNGFRSIDTLPDELAVGWVSFDDPTDSEWRTAAPERLAHLVWALRLDKRSVPAKLVDVRTRLEVKKFLERRREEIREKVLIPFASKDEKAEIRDRVRASLLSQAAPVPTMADVVWLSPADAAQTEIWLCSTTAGIVSQFTTLFSATFGLHPFLVLPWVPRPDNAEEWPEDIGKRFLTWLYEHDGGALDVSGTDVAVNFEGLTIANEAGDVVITAVTDENDSDEIKQGLANAMQVRECDLLLNISGDCYKVRVKGADFALRVEPIFWNLDREDPDGSFADKVLSLERLFHVWDNLYRLWLIQAGWLSAAAKGAPIARLSPAVAVERAAQQALTEMGAEKVEKTKTGFTATFKNGDTMSVIRGGK